MRRLVKDEENRVFLVCDNAPQPDIHRVEVRMGGQGFSIIGERTTMTGEAHQYNLLIEQDDSYPSEPLRLAVEHVLRELQSHTDPKNHFSATP